MLYRQYNDLDISLNPSLKPSFSEKILTLLLNRKKIIQQAFMYTKLKYSNAQL
jgi:hypothetical protein